MVDNGVVKVLHYSKGDRIKYGHSNSPHWTQSPVFK
jgi:hypothetical protein